MRDSFTPVSANLQLQYGLLLAQKLYNPFCESDDFLSVVLIDRADRTGRYVVWTYNSQTNGMSGGQYFTSLDDAMKEFSERGYLW